MKAKEFNGKCGDYMKGQLIDILMHYSDKGIAMLLETKNYTDNNDILIYNGVTAEGIPLMVAAVKGAVGPRTNTLSKLRYYIQKLANYTQMFGTIMVLFYDEKEDVWFRMNTQQLKECWVDTSKFTRKNLKQVRGTVYGPDFLEAIKIPFNVYKSIKSQEQDIEEHKEELAVFST